MAADHPNGALLRVLVPHQHSRVTDAELPARYRPQSSEP
jgi:hypothetical protein